MRFPKVIKKVFFSQFKSFTLIELLVVIFIIGLLVGIGAIAALNTRKKGRDAGIQATLYQVRIEATLIKNQTDPPAYTTLCNVGILNEAGYPNTLGVIGTEVRKYTPPGFTPSDYPKCYADTELYCVQFPLNTGGFYCLDSTGYAGTITNPDCEGANYDCATP